MYHYIPPPITLDAETINTIAIQYNILDALKILQQLNSWIHAH